MSIFCKHYSKPQKDREKMERTILYFSIILLMLSVFLFPKNWDIWGWTSINPSYFAVKIPGIPLGWLDTKMSLHRNVWVWKMWKHNPMSLVSTHVRFRDVKGSWQLDLWDILRPVGISWGPQLQAGTCGLMPGKRSWESQNAIGSIGSMR